MKKCIILTLVVLSIIGFTAAQERNGLVLQDTQVAIDFLYDNGLTMFSTESDFMASQSLRRDEAAAFFARFSRDVLGNTPDISKTECSSFSDLSRGHSDLQGEMIASCQLGLFKGSQGRFMPTASFTNAEALTVLVRLIDGFKDETGSHWAENYRITASNMGLANSLAASQRADLDSAISRGDVAKLIEAGAMQRGVNTIPQEDGNNTTSQEYLNAITKKYQGDGLSFNYPNDGIISIIDDSLVRITNFVPNDLGLYLPNAGNFIISITSFPISMYNSCLPMLGLDKNGEPMEYGGYDVLVSNETINGVKVYKSIPRNASSSTMQGRICIQHPNKPIQSITYGIRGGEINIESIIINSLQLTDITNINNTEQETLTQEQAEELIYQTYGDCSSPGQCNGPTITFEPDYGGQYLITAIYNQYDDSVSKMKYELLVNYNNGTWVASSHQTDPTRICHPGRGHQDRGTELCR